MIRRRSPARDLSLNPDVEERGLRRFPGFVLVSVLIVSVYAVPSGIGRETAETARLQDQPQLLEYSVATLAPMDVTVPPIVLENGSLHAMLVDLAAGSSRSEVSTRLGIAGEELEALYRLIEMEGLGMQEAGGGWKPLALALEYDSVDRLAVTAAPLAIVIADMLEENWAALDSTVSRLPVTGRLPLSQSGHILIGDYLLGLFQAEAFWEAGLAPPFRKYSFRVYRMNPGDAPSGHVVTYTGHRGWRIVRYSPSGEVFGLAALTDPGSPISRALLGGAEPDTAARVAGEIIDAYRLWYLMDTPPDPPTRRILRRLEAADGQGRLRIPIITQDDLDRMRSIAWWMGEALWEHLQALLPEIGSIAVELGYGDPEMLGEVTLAVWEMAVHEAVWDLVGRGLLLPPIRRRSQALVVRVRQ